ncbi:hypothetical protein [Pedobacter foliorum]|uniref:hypothetical protein n=1 Tax=Pedobacter foliorum TaxID=2739058 RepID=UPI001565BDA4|nr:hypothetical protein [Pedobacter foliorum]NRF37502.1 hypothetical protein [Pedobacter foliorum]
MSKYSNNAPVKKSLFLFLSIAFIAVLNLNTFGQSLTEFKEVDKFKLSNYNVKVYFKDPLLELIKTYPDFDGKENQIKHKLLSDYLFHNSLYIFQISKKKEVQKNYELFGNPQKLRERNYFNLNVLKPDGTLEKSIDKVNLGGRFFEHMVLFQSERGKQAIGKGVQIWGYFDKIEPYETFKNRITDLIKMDIENSIPDDLLAKKMAQIEPLFDYQKFGLSHVKGRKLTITVLQYDSLGNVKNKYPRIESDENLYLSSTSKELIWVMAFPFFSAQDSSIQNENRIKVSSKLENINHYLKDINVTINPTTKQVERILGKLIIHSYSSEGHSTSDVLYQAEFAAIGEFTLPKTIKYCALDDKEFKRPTLTIEVEYELK